MACLTVCFSALDAAVEPALLYPDSDVNKRHFMIACPAVTCSLTWIVFISIAFVYGVSVWWYWSSEEVQKLAG
jgi:hypothetical protein